MGDPKTVLEWLETLPEPLRQKAITDSWCLSHLQDYRPTSLASVLYALYQHASSDYWFGVRHYICGIGEDQPFFDETRDGYTAAKAAFEAQNNIPEHSPNVKYIAVAPDDHAELCRKADLYNELKAVIDRLDCEIQDLKRRFV